MSDELTEIKKEWCKLGYGMFIHFGPNTFEGKGWGEGDFPAKTSFQKI